MSKRTTWPLWLAIALLASVVIALMAPRLFGLVSPAWTTTRADARAIALERLADLGPIPDDPYVVVRLRADQTLERRLKMLERDLPDTSFRDSFLASQLSTWQVVLYDRGASSFGPGYRALVARTGELLGMQREIEEGDETGALSIDDDIARERARAYLVALGEDLDTYAAETSIQRNQTGERSDLTVRFSRLDETVGDRLPHGLEVLFAGDVIRGFDFWFDDPEPDEINAVFRGTQLLFTGRIAVYYLALLVVVVAFLKRYHDGQLGVRRGVQIFLFSLAVAVLFLALTGRGSSQGNNIGFLSRHQTTWITGIFQFMFQFVPIGILGLTSWSVGEWFCRQRWSDKLTAFDALFRGRWQNATVARASLRGVAGGLALAALGLLMVPAVEQGGGDLVTTWLYDNAVASALPALAVPGGQIAILLPLSLFAFFLVPSWAVARLGDRAGLLLAWLVAILVSGPTLLVLPLPWSAPFWLLASTVPLLMFRYGDLLSAVLCLLVGSALPSALVLMSADTPWSQANGWVTMLLLGLPLVASIRFLGSDEEVAYHYDDVPPHVRRIAERERQRVELETARGIQSAILPELPPSLSGVELAHSYLPATEVGGDFYDVLALDDGRLAVAVGDVAGHGVSSGLVMSMAKSALAVQVTFDPNVESVVTTLNRMVYQSARQRLLTTLVYALVDPARGEMLYASAGHLFPYRVSQAGAVEPLEASAYPLGVRGRIEPRVRNAKLEGGDTVFLYSDGLVEACPDGSDEPFGFDRLEESLRRNAGQPPAAMRDAVLADVDAYTGEHPREDDVTVLVLRLPPAA